MFMMEAPTSAHSDTHFVLVVMALPPKREGEQEPADGPCSSSSPVLRTLDVFVWNSMRVRWDENNNAPLLGERYDR